MASQPGHRGVDFPVEDNQDGKGDDSLNTLTHSYVVTGVSNYKLTSDKYPCPEVEVDDVVLVQPHACQPVVPADQQNPLVRKTT